MTAIASPNRKLSYTISCSTDFRDSVMALASKRKVNVADLARSVVLVVNTEELSNYPDPGGPIPGDREIVILKSGAAKGKPWQRKPRLQVRMAHGYDTVTLRRALGLALLIDKGTVDISLNDGVKRQTESIVDESLIHEAREELTRLRSIISALSFVPLPQGIKNRDDALHVLGFPPGSLPDGRSMKSRFRTLASIHHPDSSHGDHDRMSQLNEAIDHLKHSAS